VNRQHTINQARGICRFIDDRFDLTLECIKRFYTNEASPLAKVLGRYEEFFRLFGAFEEYVRFFLLNDLVDGQGRVRFYLPFDDFQSPPTFADKEAYHTYKSRVETFITSRGRRIEQCVAQIET
jgi:hypothetical protein